MCYNDHRWLWGQDSQKFRRTDNCSLLDVLRHHTDFQSNRNNHHLDDLDRLDDQIGALDDLKNQKTGVAESTAAARFLQDRGVTHNIFPSLDEGLAALSNGKINVLVHDEPIMKHVIAQKYSGTLQVLDIILDKQLYAFPSQDNAIILEQINLGIIEAMESGKLESIIQRYLPE